MNVDGLSAWLDQYAGTQVGTLMLCVNSQRSSVACISRQTVWDGYDPEAGNDQPFFAGIRDQPWFFPEGARVSMRRWVHNAWLLHRQGLDPYAHWIRRCRQHGIRPWLSMRMNDVHYVDQPEHCIHDRFWKEHPEWRRALVALCPPRGGRARAFPSPARPHRVDPRSAPASGGRGVLGDVPRPRKRRGARVDRPDRHRRHQSRRQQEADPGEAGIVQAPGGNPADQHPEHRRKQADNHRTDETRGHENETQVFLQLIYHPIVFLEGFKGFYSCQD
jgi:hypothetical protein